MPKMRSIVATLLAVLLLSGASWASVCDASCGLQQAKSSCAAAPAATTHAAMSMSMSCEHCRGLHQAAATAPCGTMDCSPAVLLRAFANEEVRHALTTLQGNVVDRIAITPSGAAVAMSGRRNPPGTLSAFPPLLVSRRI
ncbi:MAG: hypothetical protein ABI197_00170 [Granulicella sp.]